MPPSVVLRRLPPPSQAYPSDRFTNCRFDSKGIEGLLTLFQVTPPLFVETISGATTVSLPLAVGTSPKPWFGSTNDRVSTSYPGITPVVLFVVAGGDAPVARIEYRTLPATWPEPPRPISTATG